MFSLVILTGYSNVWNCFNCSLDISINQLVLTDFIAFTLTSILKTVLFTIKKLYNVTVFPYITIDSSPYLHYFGLNIQLLHIWNISQFLFSIYILFILTISSSISILIHMTNDIFKVYAVLTDLIIVTLTSVLKFVKLNNNIEQYQYYENIK